MIDGGARQSLEDTSYTAFGVHVGQRADSVRAQRSTGDLHAGRMREAILGAAVVVDCTMGCITQLYVPNGIFEVGAEKPDVCEWSLGGNERRCRAGKLKHVVCAWPATSNTS